MHDGNGEKEARQSHAWNQTSQQEAKKQGEANASNIIIKNVKKISSNKPTKFILKDITE